MSDDRRVGWADPTSIAGAVLLGLLMHVALRRWRHTSNPAEAHARLSSIEGVYVKDDGGLQVEVTRSENGDLTCKGSDILGGSVPAATPSFPVVWKVCGRR